MTKRTRKNDIINGTLAGAVLIMLFFLARDNYGSTHKPKDCCRWQPQKKDKCSKEYLKGKIEVYGYHIKQSVSNKISREHRESNWKEAMSEKYNILDSIKECLSGNVWK